MNSVSNYFITSEDEYIHGLVSPFFSLIGLSLLILCNRICELLFIFFSAVSRRIGVFHKWLF